MNRTEENIRIDDTCSCSWSNDDTISRFTESTIATIDVSQTKCFRMPLERSNSSVFHRIFFLEPAIALVFFASRINSIVFHNELLYLTCRNVYKFDEEDCEPLRELVPSTNKSKEIAVVVGPYVANINLANSLIETILPAFLILLIGAWSDRYGRKPFILFTLSGLLVGYIFLCILSAIPNVQPWFFVMRTIPSALTGGTCTLLGLSFSYISDGASTATKGIRLVNHFVAISLGVNLGILVSGTVFAASNLPSLYGISITSIALAIQYVWYIPEFMQPEQASRKAKLRDLFRWQSIKDLLKTCTVKRPDHHRTIIWLSIIPALISNIAQEGTSSVNYAFLKAEFGVGIGKYVQFTVITGGIQIFGGLTGMFVFRRQLRLTLLQRSLIALSSLIMQSVVLCVVSEWWQLYLGSSLGLFGGIIVPLLLAIIAQIIPSHEAGKIFSFATSLITLSPLMANPIYDAIFDATVHIYPGLFHIMNIFLYLLCFFLVSSSFLIQLKGGQDEIL